MDAAAVYASFICNYLIENGGICRDCLVVLKSGRVSNCYFNARILNESVTGSNAYAHGKFLMMVGAMISEHACSVGADVLVGIATTGVTLAKFAGQASGIDVREWNPHENGHYPAHVEGRRVLVIDDTLTTGKSMLGGVKASEAAGANVVGALALISRNPDKISKADVGLYGDAQRLISLYDVDFEIVAEEVNDYNTLLRSGLPVRLDLGYAATYRLLDAYPKLVGIGEPVYKSMPEGMEPFA